MLSQEVVRKIKDNTSYVEFQQHIAEEVDKLDSIAGLEDMSNERAGQEVKARARAAQILREILSPFFEYAEKQPPTKEEVEKAKNKFGLG